jgi:hypothetical protein
MDMMTITQLAQQTDLAPPTVRRYLGDFILYVPSVRVDGTIGFPPEAVTVINTINSLMQRGHSHSEILAKLEATYPITVISAQPLAAGESIPSSIPAITKLLETVDDRYGALAQEIGHLRSDIDAYALSGPLAHVPAELAQVRQVISMLAKRVADSRSTANPDLAAMHLEIAELRAAVQDHWASSPSLDTIASLKNEVALLKQQLAEMRNERGQLLALMTNVQDTLQQLHHDQVDGLGAISSVATPTHLFSLGAATMSPSTGSRSSAEPSSPGSRTPRRLGHTTAR